MTGPGDHDRLSDASVLKPTKDISQPKPRKKRSEMSRRANSQASNTLIDTSK